MPYLKTKDRTTQELAAIYRRMWQRSWHHAPPWFGRAMRIAAHCLAMEHPTSCDTPTQPTTPKQ
jgi:hypothetical protein